METEEKLNITNNKEEYQKIMNKYRESDQSQASRFLWCFVSAFLAMLFILVGLNIFCGCTVAMTHAIEGAVASELMQEINRFDTPKTPVELPKSNK